MLCRWTKTFAPRSADRVACHDIQRTGNGQSLYRTHENLSFGACGAGVILCVVSRFGPHLWRNGLLEKKALADASLHPGWGSFRTVPVYAGRVRDCQQIVIPVQEEKAHLATLQVLSFCHAERSEGPASSINQLVPGYPPPPSPLIFWNHRVTA